MALGATVVEAAAIRTLPVDDPAPLDDAIRRLERYAWLILTSPNGVRILLERLRAAGSRVEALRFPRVAAIGPATAGTLRDAGIRVDVLPAGQFQAEGLLEALRPLLRPGDRVLLLRAAEGRPVLPEGLGALGAIVEEVAAYRTVRDAIDASSIHRALQQGEIDAVTFTSGSTVRQFVDLVGAEALRGSRRPRIVCLGPVTAEAAAEVGISVDRVAEQGTMEGLVHALVAALTEREGVT
jgi:uroporphyrinogen III methyltransferase/synthase